MNYLEQRQMFSEMADEMMKYGHQSPFIALVSPGDWPPNVQFDWGYIEIKQWSHVPSGYIRILTQAQFDRSYADLYEADHAI